MKELANSFAQLVAIIMLLVTLAVSTAAVSQWVSPETSGAVLQAQPLSIPDAR